MNRKLTATAKKNTMSFIARRSFQVVRQTQARAGARRCVGDYKIAEKQAIYQARPRRTTPHILSFPRAHVCGAQQLPLVCPPRERTRKPHFRSPLLRPIPRRQPASPGACGREFFRFRGAKFPLLTNCLLPATFLRITTGERPLARRRQPHVPQERRRRQGVCHRRPRGHHARHDLGVGQTLEHGPRHGQDRWLKKKAC